MQQDQRVVVPEAPRGKKSEQQIREEREAEIARRVKAAVEEMKLSKDVKAQIAKEMPSDKPGMKPEKVKTKRAATEKQKKHLANARAAKKVYSKLAKEQGLDVRKERPRSIPKDNNNRKAVTDFGVNAPFKSYTTYHLGLTNGDLRTKSRDNLTKVSDGISRQNELTRNYWDNGRRSIFALR